MTSRIRLITFDAYNTVFKPRGGISAQYEMEARKFGINVSKEAITRSFRPALNAQISKYPLYGLSQGLNPRTWWKDVVRSTFIGAGASEKDLDEQFPALYETIWTRFTCADGYEVFSDVFDTLKELKSRKVTLGVISNSDERVAQVLESLKLDSYFDFVLTSSMARCEKPDRAIFDQALRLGSSKSSSPIQASQALHIGDDLKRDYLGARDAGWHSLLLRRDKLSYEEPLTNLPSDSENLPIEITYMRELLGYIKTPNV
ncbi:HAD-like domain-containing protein [Umbelopsis sp. PMI_123]|nr:HAD-like domain-containing protein [Umbelopsis sp. PMI_123]